MTTAPAELTYFQGAVRRVGDMALEFHRQTGRYPSVVRIPQAEAGDIESGCRAFFGVRQTEGGAKQQMCGMDLVFHDGDSWSVTR